MTEGQIEKFKEIIHLHNQFSAAFKEVEQIGDKIDTLSTNDMRYALRGVVDCILAVIEKDDSSFNDNASNVKTALNIAWHDVIDITSKLFSVYLDKLVRKYGADIVANFLDYSKARDVIFNIQDIQKKTRGDRKKRAELYASITESDLSELMACYRKAVTFEPAIAAASKKEKVRMYLLQFSGFGVLMGVAYYTGLLPEVIEIVKGLFSSFSSDATS